MDTLIILAILASLIVLWRFPQHKAGFVLFWIALIASILLFNYHVTSSLNLSF